MSQKPVLVLLFLVMGCYPDRVKSHLSLDCNVSTAARGFASCDITSSGVPRRYLLALPPRASGPLPLVIALHGDPDEAGSVGTPEKLRNNLKMESFANGGVIFVYPERLFGGDMYKPEDYRDLYQRGREAVFVRDVIGYLSDKGLVNPKRVLLTGFGGGGAMANIIGCMLGSSVLRAVAPMSGSIWRLPDEGGSYGTLPNGMEIKGCDDPSAAVIWGAADRNFMDGEWTRDEHREHQHCLATTQMATPSPCVDYKGCTQALRFCPVPGLDHGIWEGAGAALWTFFSSLP